MSDDGKIERKKRIGKGSLTVGGVDLGTVNGGWVTLFEWPYCRTCATFTWAHSHAGAKEGPRYMGTPDDGMYAVLGLSAGASKVAVRSAYRVLMKMHHPDHGGDENVARRIIAAYDELRARGLAP